ncbi:OadG family protein [Thalassotalea agarivorans]|uniref:Probable oxaloacetate decarboxylase gamma chain n=1 Tax=Thalassotalea agarivorans TaxID=349064 RepID=A0A1H9ZBI8_THASX|nr:OadG family transporter subunit [Thalassotalea agarivorans]SES78984.1 oxaloacetate decarboxylase, gamma subunit [Thalassotalea agarivorans]
MENLAESFIEAATLMLLGMVFVFAFLGLLVVFINTVMAKLAKTFPDAPTPQRAVKPVQTKISDGVSPSIVAAVSAAVSQYRAKYKK